MNNRLVWNFEITSEPLLDWSHLRDEKDEIRWEARFFWPDNSIICLRGLDERFLEIGNYEIKHRDDCYFLLAENNFNIKLRRAELMYKPLINKTNELYGYGKKINLADYPDHHLLPAAEGFTSSTLLTQLERKAQKIAVTKEALVYKFFTMPIIKLELARLKINQKYYFSVCIEGRSQQLVTTIAKHLLKEQTSCDYINFLRQFSDNGQ